MNTVQRNDLEELARGLMQEHEIPGVALGVYEGGDETIVTLGSAAADPPRDVGPSTIFQIGSVTKTITTLALMRKVERGTLDLDTPLRRFLPEFMLTDPDWAERVTPRHLLTHTASWEGDHGFEERAKDRGEDALERLVEQIPRVSLLTPPGTVYHYNNLAFSVAGRLLEVLHETCFERAIEEVVLDPLKLEVFFHQEHRPAKRVAAGHPEAVVPRSDWPAGGAQCDVRTLLRYARAHLGAENAISETAASAQTLAAMWAPAVEMDHRPRHMGLSWMLDAIDDCAIVLHSGSTRGQTALLELVPDRDFALVALTNSGNGGGLCWQAARWAREHLLDLVESDPEYVRLSDEMLQQYHGAYIHSHDVVFHIEPREDGRDGGLEIRGTDRWELSRGPIEFVEPDRFLVSDGPLEEDEGTFIRDDDGEIRWLRWWGRLHARMERA
jgi:CubicO group peptidase (beta-lactamase class C family)